jgi:SAM-dependent methyltransferase
MSESRPIIRRVASKAVGTIIGPRPWLPASFGSSVAAKYIPLPRRDNVVIDEYVPADRKGELPVPPVELWENYGLTTEEYLESGRLDVATMLRLLTEAHGSLPPLGRVLDLGCAAGRMLRFVPREGDCEHWGIDINAQHIAWCQANLTPPCCSRPGRRRLTSHSKTARST